MRNARNAATRSEPPTESPVRSGFGRNDMRQARAGDDNEVIRSRIEELCRERPGEPAAARGHRAPRAPQPPYYVAGADRDRAEAGIDSRTSSPYSRQVSITALVGASKPDLEGHSLRRQTAVGAALDARGQSSSISLREACTLVGCDNAGQRCPDCNLARYCSDDSRWLVKGHHALGAKPWLW